MNPSPSPRVSISLQYDTMGKRAAHEIAELLHQKPDAVVIGLATGSTPLATYKELIRMHREEGLDFSKATFFNLDEYVGLPQSHPESYHSFMEKNLFGPLGVRSSQINILNGNAPDLQAECDRFERKIHAAGGIDLQVLGIGGNGHIGFSEPGTPFEKGTHLVTLSEQTRKDNARFFGNDIAQVPSQALTMGPATIMKAKRVLLLANGESKVDAIYAALKGEVTPSLPASILQKHPNAAFYLDRKAAKDFDLYFAAGKGEASAAAMR